MTTGGDRLDEMVELLGEGVDNRIPYTALLGPLVGDRGGRVLTNLGVVATRLRDDVQSWPGTDPAPELAAYDRGVFGGPAGAG